jgi:parallel beta-helix repeat protein
MIVRRDKHHHGTLSESTEPSGVSRRGFIQAAIVASTGALASAVGCSDDETLDAAAGGGGAGTGGGAGGFDAGGGKTGSGGASGKAGAAGTAGSSGGGGAAGQAGSAGHAGAAGSGGTAGGGDSGAPGCGAAAGTGPTPTDAVYVADFGVTGNGSDETSKVQNALDYARDSSSTKTVVFPPGKVITITGLVVFHEGLTIMGNCSTLKREAGSSIQGSMVSLKDGAHCSGLIVDGNCWASTGVEDCWTSSNVTLSDNGVRVFSNATFTNNEVKNVRAYSVAVYAGTHCTITNNTIHDSCQYGIATGGGTGGDSYNTVCTGNTIYNCQQVGIKIRGTYGGTITGNHITMLEHSQFGRGISLYSLDGANDNILIDNNTIVGSSKGGNMDGISSDDANNSNIRITNNTISKCSVGIDLKFTEGTITGNTISECSTCISGESGNTVSNNTCA